MLNDALVNVLARSFLAGEPTIEGVVARAAHTLGHRWGWLRPLARTFVETFEAEIRPRRRDVVRFLLDNELFRRACRRHRKRLRIEHWVTDPQAMQPVAAAETWPIPAIESAGALAEWLGIDPAELDWFANLKSFSQHYRYRVLAKDAANIRIIEAPKPRLKELQRQILTGILEKIPPHPAAHGFLKTRSVKTFAAPHTGQRVVIRMDLRDFFPSISAARIQACFRTMGYPDFTATLLTGLCTNATPRAIGSVLYCRRHLPQGAPTSPALANRVMYRADCRLTGLAQAAGAHYTRYADDVAFSGDSEFENGAEPFSLRAAAILIEEGFEVYHRKTRIMRQGVRQHLAGLVMNRHINVMRPDFDRLKATLTNCVRHGPQSQNRESHPAFRQHLEGRVAWVESVNPARGKRLRGILEKIEWP